MTFEIDLFVDLNAEDDSGLPWTLLDEARDPNAIIPGRDVIVGAGSVSAVAQVVDVADDGVVHVRPFQARSARTLISSVTAARPEFSLGVSDESRPSIDSRDCREGLVDDGSPQSACAFEAVLAAEVAEVPPLLDGIGYRYPFDGRGPFTGREERAIICDSP